MGNFCSCCNNSVDDTPLKNGMDSSTLYSGRLANDGEIDSIVQAIKVEPFQKDRTIILKRLDGILLTQSDTMKLLRALSNDTEKLEFLKVYHIQIKSPNVTQITSQFHGSTRKQEVRSLFNSV